MKNERCSYCGKRGHWRPDCPEIAQVVRRIRLVNKTRVEIVSTPVTARTRKLNARWTHESEQPIVVLDEVDLEDCLIDTPMKQVRVEKAKLLEILKKNRAEHRSVFLEAQKTFRQVAIKALDAQLKAARGGKPFELTRLVELMAPEDHTKDYDRSIEMLEMSVDDHITVDEREFQNYVQDVWSWSHNWAVSNVKYVNKNTRSYGKLSALAGMGE